MCHCHCVLWIAPMFQPSLSRMLICHLCFSKSLTLSVYRCHNMWKLVIVENDKSRCRKDKQLLWLLIQDDWRWFAANLNPPDVLFCGIFNGWCQLKPYRGTGSCFVGLFPGRSSSAGARGLQSIVTMNNHKNHQLVTPPRKQLRDQTTYQLIKYSWCLSSYFQQPVLIRHC